MVQSCHVKRTIPAVGTVEIATQQTLSVVIGAPCLIDTIDSRLNRIGPLRTWSLIRPSYRRPGTRIKLRQRYCAYPIFTRRYIADLSGRTMAN